MYTFYFYFRSGIRENVNDCILLLLMKVNPHSFYSLVLMVKGTGSKYIVVMFFCVKFFYLCLSHLKLQPFLFWYLCCISVLIDWPTTPASTLDGTSGYWYKWSEALPQECHVNRSAFVLIRPNSADRARVFTAMITPLKLNGPVLSLSSSSPQESNGPIHLKLQVRPRDTSKAAVIKFHSSL